MFLLPTFRFSIRPLSVLCLSTFFDEWIHAVYIGARWSRPNARHGIQAWSSLHLEQNLFRYIPLFVIIINQISAVPNYYTSSFLTTCSYCKQPRKTQLVILSYVLATKRTQADQSLLFWNFKNFGYRKMSGWVNFQWHALVLLCTPFPAEYLSP